MRNEIEMTKSVTRGVRISAELDNHLRFLKATGAINISAFVRDAIVGKLEREGLTAAQLITPEAGMTAPEVGLTTPVPGLTCIGWPQEVEE